MLLKRAWSNLQDFVHIADSGHTWNAVCACLHGTYCTAIEAHGVLSASQVQQHLLSFALPPARLIWLLPEICVVAGTGTRCKLQP